MAVVAAYTLYLPTSGFDRFYFDSFQYWDLARTFHDRAGHASLFAYHEPLRGYFYPLALAGLRAVVAHTPLDPVTLVRVANAVLVALLGVVLLPALVRRILPGGTVTPIRIVAFNALLFVFWRDHLNFPLADFPALALASVALLLVLQPQWYALLGAGLAAGLALNVRPAYLYPMLLLVPFAALRACRAVPEPQWRKAAVAAGSVGIGLAIALAPQSAINHRAFDRFTPLPVANHELSLSLLTQGMHRQKYESVLTNSGQAVFMDPATEAILSARNREGVGSYSQYIDLLVHHPRVMLSGYFRRTFNGFDVQYTSPYVRDIWRDRSALRSLLLYTILFAAIVLPIGTHGRRLRRGADPWLSAVFLIPVLLVVPSAVETRYFLPGAVAAYAMVCFGLTVANPRGLLKRATLPLVALYSVFVIACFSLADQTYALLQLPEQPVIYNPHQ